jgi:hypothetical protein
MVDLMRQCGYVGYESHEYRIEETGGWTPLSVIVEIRGRSKENQKRAVGDPRKPIVVFDRNRLLDGGTTKTPTDSDLQGVDRKKMAQIFQGARVRIGFIDKVQEEAMIDDGAKLADDVLALPVWAAAPSIRFKTIGVQLTKKREDTEALDE